MMKTTKERNRGQGGVESGVTVASVTPSRNYSQWHGQTSPDDIYADPAGYLGSLGIEAEVVAETHAKGPRRVLAAA